jgi:hypothetical protein
MNPRFYLPLLACLATLLAAGRAQAHWVTQSFDLKAGWNAVFLHVDASHATIAQHLATDPNASIEEIWLWQPPASLAQFVQSPQDPVNGGSQWRAWKRTEAGASVLQHLTPNAAYLVRVRSDLATFSWNLKGKAIAPRYQWTSSGLNFLGFPTATGSAPTFEDFLAQSPPEFQQTAEIFRYPGGDLGPGNPLQVLTLRTTTVNRGEAYWIRAGEVYNRYYGPFEVVANGTGLVSLGDEVSVTSVRLRNLTPNPLTVSLNLVASEAPPSGEPAIVNVPPLLVRGERNPTNLSHTYVTLPVGTARSWTLAPYGQPGSDTEVVVGLDRSTFTGNVGDLFAGVLRFTDALGQSRVDLGLSATVGSTAGLWVGNAVVAEVGHYLKTFQRNADNTPVTLPDGRYATLSTNTSLGAVPATYPLRLIVHNPPSGSATLFQQIFVGPNAATNPIVANQEESLGSALLAQARRISAAHLPWTDGNAGWNFSGNLAQGATINVSVTNRFNNRVSNPFLHTYHPDHDTLDPRFQQEVPQGSESYTLVRNITLSLLPPADDFSSRVASGQSLIGQYSETIRLLGLARPGNTFDTREFEVRGLFNLNRISQIATVTRP